MLVRLLAGGLFVLPATPRSQQVSIYEKHWRGSYSNTKKKVLQRTFSDSLHKHSANKQNVQTSFRICFEIIFLNMF